MEKRLPTPSASQARQRSTGDDPIGVGKRTFLELKHRHLARSRRWAPPPSQCSSARETNTITISAPSGSYGPDIDSITVQATTAQYLADAAHFNNKDIAIVASPEGTDGKNSVLV
jgi:hypothetical protein